jgi:methionine synthase II (cobalamin-independent)
LRALEDEAIRDAMRRQIDLGLDVITDGEFRRWMFLNSFYDAVEGFRTDNVVTFRNARGEDVPLRVHEIVDHLRLVDSPAAREAAFMSAVADGYPFKITFPAPSLFGHPFSYKPGVTSGYGSLEEFVAHAIQIERRLVADAIKAGTRYVQFDLSFSGDLRRFQGPLWPFRPPGRGCNKRLCAARSHPSGVPCPRWWTAARPAVPSNWSAAPSSTGTGRSCAAG